MHATQYIPQLREEELQLVRIEEAQLIHQVIMRARFTQLQVEVVHELLLREVIRLEDCHAGAM